MNLSISILPAICCDETNKKWCSNYLAHIHNTYFHTYRRSYHHFMALYLAKITSTYFNSQKTTTTTEKHTITPKPHCTHTEYIIVDAFNYFCLLGSFNWKLNKCEIHIWRYACPCSKVGVGKYFAGHGLFGDAIRNVQKFVSGVWFARRKLNIRVLRNFIYLKWNFTLFAQIGLCSKIYWAGCERARRNKADIGIWLHKQANKQNLFVNRKLFGQKTFIIATFQEMVMHN